VIPLHSGLDALQTQGQRSSRRNCAKPSQYDRSARQLAGLHLAGSLSDAELRQRRTRAAGRLTRGGLGRRRWRSGRAGTLYGDEPRGSSGELGAVRAWHVGGAEARLVLAEGCRRAGAGSSPPRCCGCRIAPSSIGSLPRRSAPSGRLSSGSTGRLTTGGGEQARQVRRLLDQRRRMSAQLERWYAQFGLTPASRPSGCEAERRLAADIARRRPSRVERPAGCLGGRGVRADDQITPGTGSGRGAAHTARGDRDREGQRSALMADDEINEGIDLLLYDVVVAVCGLYRTTTRIRS